MASPDADDTILVTIDCWRHDAPTFMPEFQSVTGEWESRDMITGAAATNGVFPALFASSYSPRVYDGTGQVEEDVTPLPAVFERSGYETAGFVASNPYLQKWREYFGSWSNEGFESTDGVTTAEDASVARKLRNFVFLGSAAEATDIFDMADDWWSNHDSPRFLWVHLMEPHEPYKPGLRLGTEYGLFKTYAALVGMRQFRESIERYERIRQSLKDLHFQCVRHLDRTLARWLDGYDGLATILVLGDHGEEFDHGIVRHARLYDETVRVPLYSNQPELLPPSPTVRQIDFAPSIATELDTSLPPDWEGEPWGDEMPPQPMFTYSPGKERGWVGIRSQKWKIIRAYELQEGFVGSEAYNLAADPEEVTPLPRSDAPSRLNEQLDDFVSRDDIAAEMRQATDSQFKNATSRLRDLGYLE
jgi:arylsulfatase A-like enzyme